jgi:hypothetical protein
VVGRGDDVPSIWTRVRQWAHIRMPTRTLQEDGKMITLKCGALAGT